MLAIYKWFARGSSILSQVWLLLRLWALCYVILYFLCGFKWFIRYLFPRISTYDQILLVEYEQNVRNDCVTEPSYIQRSAITLLFLGPIVFIMIVVSPESFGVKNICAFLFILYLYIPCIIICFAAKTLLWYTHIMIHILCYIDIIYSFKLFSVFIIFSEISSVVYNVLKILLHKNIYINIIILYCPILDIYFMK